MTFRAINRRLYWNTTPLDEVAAKEVLGSFLDHGAVGRYWALHDAMVEAGYIPARPAPPEPDFASYDHPKAEPFISEGAGRS